MPTMQIGPLDSRPLSSGERRAGEFAQRTMNATENDAAFLGLITRDVAARALVGTAVLYRASLDEHHAAVARLVADAPSGMTVLPVADPARAPLSPNAPNALPRGVAA